MMIGMKIIGTTPDAFANVPVYILLTPEGQDILGSGKFWAYNLAQKEPGAWAKNPKKRKDMWDKLEEMIGEK